MNWNINQSSNEIRDAFQDIKFIMQNAKISCNGKWKLFTKHLATLVDVYGPLTKPIVG